MADKFDTARNNPDSLGRKLRVATSFPWTVPDGVRAVWSDADGTCTIRDADGASNEVTGLGLKAGVVMNFVPEYVHAIATATKLFYVI